jgi:hypothetical protein
VKARGSGRAAAAFRDVADRGSARADSRFAQLGGARAAAALCGLLAGLVLYDAFAGELPATSNSWDTALVAVVLLPATFAVVWLLLPLAPARGLLLLAVALGALAVSFHLAGLGALFNVTKLVALALFGFWFLELFQAASWVVLVACIIPWVDALSVWRGPTEYVVSEQPGLFDRISIAFRLPGEEASANLGPPDVIFFALFLATAARFRLRPRWTWAAMTGLLSLTLVLTVVFDVAGLPALPAICLGFLLPNADLLWRLLRRGDAVL